MTASETIYSDLSGFAGLQALVGNGDSPETYRIYPSEAPQDVTRPFVVYQLISGSRETPLSDAGGTGVENNLYQISVYSLTVKEADSVMEQARLALKNSSTPYVPINKREGFETQTKLHVIQYDFSQWYK